MISLLISHSLSRADDPPPAEEPLLEERRLMLALPEDPRPGHSWVVQFPGCDPLRTHELLATLASPPLDLAFHERQNHSLVIGLAAAGVGQALVIGGFAMSANGAFDYETDNDRLVPIGLGIMAAGLVVDFAVVRHFVRFARREREPAAWLDVREAAVAVEQYNASR